MTTLPVFNGSEIELIPLPPEITALAQDLPEDAPAYFVTAEGQTELPVDQLVLSHLRPEGVANAVRYMAAARNGRQAPRAPIDVQSMSDGRWLVIDGNSTAAIARAAGWSIIPAMIVATDSDG